MKNEKTKVVLRVVLLTSICLFSIITINVHQTQNNKLENLKAINIEKNEKFSKKEETNVEKKAKEEENIFLEEQQEKKMNNSTQQSKKTENKNIEKTTNTNSTSNSRTPQNDVTDTTPPVQNTNNNTSNVEVSKPQLNPYAVDTSDILYPSHHGIIHYSSYDICTNAGFEKSFADESIKSFSCIEVRSVNRSILGYYLEIRR